MPPTIDFVPDVKNDEGAPGAIDFQPDQAAAAFAQSSLDSRPTFIPTLPPEENHKLEAAKEMALALPQAFGIGLGAVEKGVGAAIGQVAGTGDTLDDVRRAVEEGAPLPVELAAERARGVGGTLARVGLGLAETAPKIAAMSLFPGSILSQSIAAGGIFGLDAQGRFSPRAAAVGALLPGAGALAKGSIARMLAGAMERGTIGTMHPATQWITEEMGHQAALNTVMLAADSPELIELYHTDRDAFRRKIEDTIGMNLAFGLFGGFKRLRGAPTATQEYVRKNAEKFANIADGMITQQIVGGGGQQAIEKAIAEAKSRQKYAGFVPSLRPESGPEGEPKPPELMLPPLQPEAQAQPPGFVPAVEPQLPPVEPKGPANAIQIGVQAPLSVEVSPEARPKVGGQVRKPEESAEARPAAEAIAPPVEPKIVKNYQESIADNDPDALAYLAEYNAWAKRRVAAPNGEGGVRSPEQRALDDEAIERFGDDSNFPEIGWERRTKAGYRWNRQTKRFEKPSPVEPAKPVEPPPAAETEGTPPIFAGTPPPPKKSSIPIVIEVNGVQQPAYFEGYGTTATSLEPINPWISRLSDGGWTTGPITPDAKIVWGKIPEAPKPVEPAAPAKPPEATPKSPEAPSTKPTEAVKNPWEMTKAEFSENPVSIKGPDILPTMDWISAKLGGRKPIKEIAGEVGTIEFDRALQVANALRQGKVVPPEVLAEYPDLKPTSEKAETPPVQTKKPKTLESAILDFSEYDIEGLPNIFPAFRTKEGSQITISETHEPRIKKGDPRYFDDAGFWFPFDNGEVKGVIYGDESGAVNGNTEAMVDASEHGKTGLFISIRDLDAAGGDYKKALQEKLKQKPSSAAPPATNAGVKFEVDDSAWYGKSSTGKKGIVTFSTPVPQSIHDKLFDVENRKYVPSDIGKSLGVGKQGGNLGSFAVSYDWTAEREAAFRKLVNDTLAEKPGPAAEKPPTIDRTKTYTEKEAEDSGIASQLAREGWSFNLFDRKWSFKQTEPPKPPEPPVDLAPEKPTVQPAAPETGTVPSGGSTPTEGGKAPTGAPAVIPAAVRSLTAEPGESPGRSAAAIRTDIRNAKAEIKRLSDIQKRLSRIGDKAEAAKRQRKIDALKEKLRQYKGELSFKTVVRRKREPGTLSEGITSEDGLLYEIVGRLGKVPIFMPDGIVMAQYKRLKSLSFRTPAQVEALSKILESFPQDFEGQFGSDGSIARAAWDAAKRAGIAGELFQPVKDGSRMMIDADFLEPLKRSQGIDFKTREFFEELKRLCDAHYERTQGRGTDQAEGAAAEKEVKQGEALKHDLKTETKDTTVLLPEDVHDGTQFTLKGTKVKVIDLGFDEDGRLLWVMLDDGNKYGTQRVDLEDGRTELRMDVGSLKQPKGTETADDFLPPEAEPVVEAPAPKPKTPDVAGMSYDELVKATYAGEKARRELGDAPDRLRKDSEAFFDSGLSTDPATIEKWLEEQRGTMGAVEGLVKDIVRLQKVIQAVRLEAGATKELRRRENAPAKPAEKPKEPKPEPQVMFTQGQRVKSGKIEGALTIYDDGRIAIRDDKGNEFPTLIDKIEAVPESPKPADKPAEPKLTPEEEWAKEQADLEKSAGAVIAALREVSALTGEEKHAATGIATGRGGQMWSEAIDGKFTPAELEATRRWLMRAGYTDTRLVRAVEGAIPKAEAPPPPAPVVQKPRTIGKVTLKLKEQFEAMPAGRCFVNAQKWALKNGGIVVHGKLTINGERFDHAWVEKDGDVIDPTQGIRVDLVEFYRETKAEKDATYTGEKAAALMVRIGNTGPWTKAEADGRYISHNGAEPALAKGSVPENKEVPKPIQPPAANLISATSVSSGVRVQYRDYKGTIRSHSRNDRRRFVADDGSEMTLNPASQVRVLPDAEQPKRFQKPAEPKLAPEPRPFVDEIKKTVTEDRYSLTANITSQQKDAGYTHRVKFKSGSQSYIALLRPEKRNVGARAMFNHPEQLDVFHESDQGLQRRLARIDFSEINAPKISESSGANPTPKPASEPKLSEREQKRLSDLQMKDRANRDAIGRGELGDPLTPEEQREYEELTAKAGQRTLFDVDEVVAGTERTTLEGQLKWLEAKLAEMKRQQLLSLTNAQNRQMGGDKAKEFMDAARTYEKRIGEVQNEIVDIKRKLRIGLSAEEYKAAPPEPEGALDLFGRPAPQKPVAPKPAEPAKPSQDAAREEIADIERKLTLLDAEWQDANAKRRKKKAMEIGGEITKLNERLNLLKSDLTEGQGEVVLRTPIAEDPTTGEMVSKEYRLRQMTSQEFMDYFKDPMQRMRDFGTVYTPWRAEMRRVYYDESGKETRHDPWYIDAIQKTREEAIEKAASYSGRSADGWKQIRDTLNKPKGQEISPEQPSAPSSAGKAGETKSAGAAAKPVAGLTEAESARLAELTEKAEANEPMTKAERERFVELQKKAGARGGDERPEVRPGGDEPPANLGGGLEPGEGMQSEAEVRAAIAGEDTAGFPVKVITQGQAAEITGVAEARGYGGFFWKGNVYLVRENLSRDTKYREQVRQLLREEVGHGLLRTQAGRRLLSEVLDAGKLNLTDAERQKLLDMGYREHQLLDEFIAKSARENLPWWRQMVERARVMLSKLGLAKLSNEEVSRMLLRQIRAEIARPAELPAGEAALAPSPAVGRQPEIPTPEGERPNGPKMGVTQVAGEKIGIERPREFIAGIRQRVRTGYFDGSQPVEPGRTEDAWQIAQTMVNPETKGTFASDLQRSGGGEMAPGLLRNELWDYAVRQAVRGDTRLMEFMVRRSQDFQTLAGEALADGDTALGRGLRAAKDRAFGGMWSRLIGFRNEQLAATGRRLQQGEAGLRQIIEAIDGLVANIGDIDAFERGLRTPEIQRIIDRTSDNGRAADEVVGNATFVPPERRSTILETVYQWMSREVDPQADQATFVDTLKAELQRLRLTPEQAQTIADATWNRKLTVDGVVRRRLWDKELRKLDNLAEKTADSFILSVDQAEWKRPEQPNEVRDIIKEALKSEAPLDSNNLLGFKRDLTQRLLTAGLSEEKARDLANAITTRRETDLLNAQLRVRNQAAESKSLKSLVESLKASPYLAQGDPQWRFDTAVRWFESNGVPREQAQEAAKMFDAQFVNALTKAAEQAAKRLITKGDYGRNIPELIEAVRLGLTDPNKNWTDEIAKREGFRPLLPEAQQRLAELEQKYANPNLSAHEQVALVEQMMGIVRHAGDGKGRVMKIMGESFAASLLSGIRTMSLNWLQPWFTMLATGASHAAFEPRDFPTVVRSMWNASKNWWPEYKYAWSKDAYELSSEEQVFHSNALKTAFEEAQTDWAKGKYSQAILKFTYGWQQYVIRGLQSADQAGMVVAREWKMALYGSIAMREAGLKTSQITELVDIAAGFKRAEYERALYEGKSHNEAQVIANESTIDALTNFFENKLGSRQKAEAVKEAALYDAFNIVGRRAPGVEESDEGFLSRYSGLNRIMRFVSETRREGGGASMLTIMAVGFMNVPLRTARFYAGFGPYGILRWGIDKYRTNRGYTENLWKQSYKNEYQSKARLREALIGTSLMLAFLGWQHRHHTSDEDAEKKAFAMYVTGSGPSNKTMRDAWLKRGFEPYALHVIADGKIRSKLPINRVGQILAFPLGLAASLDDLAWRRKQEQATSPGKKEFAGREIVAAMGTYYNIVGAQGVLQAFSHLSQMGQGQSGTGRAVGVSLASTASAVLIPGKSLIQGVTDMITGPVDRSSVEAAMVSNVPVLNALWNGQAINRFGDPVGDRTWSAKLTKLGFPILLRVSDTPENKALYQMILDKGAPPPDLRRYIVEDKYGPLSQDDWQKFVKISGSALKSEVLSNLDTLNSTDPHGVKLFMNRAADIANDQAAQALHLTPKPTFSSSSGSSGGSAVPTLPKSNVGLPSSARISVPGGASVGRISTGGGSRGYGGGFGPGTTGIRRGTTGRLSLSGFTGGQRRFVHGRLRVRSTRVSGLRRKSRVSIPRRTFRRRRISLRA